MRQNRVQARKTTEVRGVGFVDPSSRLREPAKRAAAEGGRLTMAGRDSGVLSRETGIGSARAVTGPGFPQIRTCGIPASGSSCCRFATRVAGWTARHALVARGGVRRTAPTTTKTDAQSLTDEEATSATGAACHA